MIVLGDNLRDHLHSRHSLSYNHCRDILKFPLDSQNQLPQPAQQITSLSGNSEAWGSLNGQMAVLMSSPMESLLSLLVEALLPLELRPLDQEGMNCENMKQKFCWWITSGKK